MIQGHWLVDFCWFGTSATYALSGFACCTGLSTLGLNWNMGHGSLSAFCSAPARQDALQQEHAVTNAISWTFEGVHTDTDGWAILKEIWVAVIVVLGSKSSFLPQTFISLVVICKSSFHELHEISLFLASSLKKVSVTQTSQSSQLDTHAGCPAQSPVSYCVCLHLTSFEGRESSNLSFLCVEPGRSFHGFIPQPPDSENLMIA